MEMTLASDQEPQSFHSDQGRQFTSSAIVQRLKAEAIEISWSGRKRCYCFAEACGYENILVEPLSSNGKEWEIHRRAYGENWKAEISLDPSSAAMAMDDRHSTLGEKSTHEVYTVSQP